MNPTLLSPVTGEPLRLEGAGILRDADGRQWPVVDGIPFLRVGREDLVREAAMRIAAGDREGALVLLLADQDDWWTGERSHAEALRSLVRDCGRLSLRDAMALLGFGRVSDYFAHRWSDPTYMAGLALLEAHWRPARSAFELACGIGHYGRDLARRNAAYTGADVVFAKLWLARHWVVPAEARLLCFDAAAPWPIGPLRFDLVVCHDAFYFLEPKHDILARLRAAAGPGGRLAIGHVHNSGADNLSRGHAISVADLARMFPDGIFYDDAELTRAVVERRVPLSAPAEALGHVEAFAVEDRGSDLPARSLDDGLAMPPQEAALRLNPLYAASDGAWHIVWPSPRYEAEYRPRATYPLALERGAAARSIAAGCGPERDDAAVRRRLLVDLPERW